MSLQESIEDMSNISLTSLDINGSNFNVNREVGKDLYILQNFGDCMPQYDSENDLHLKLSTKKSNIPIIVPLNKYISQKMIIKGANDMTNEVYYKALVSGKTAVVDHIIRQTYAKGYENPSAVQALATLELIQGRDILCQAKSGTGKTHTFTSGTLYHLDPSDNKLQYLYITSSHEVAMQIYEHIKYLAPVDTQIALCIGQKKNNAEISTGGFKSRNLKSNNAPKTLREEKTEAMNAQIIVGTMGKIYDFIYNRKFIDLSYLKALCIDEFDSMVVSKSRNRPNSTIISTDLQLAHIIESIPRDTQRIFFSATLENTDQSIITAHSYFRKPDVSTGDPFIAMLDIEDYTLEGIKQYYVECRDFFEKKEVLLDLLKQLRINQAIIFTNKTDTAIEIKYFLDNQKVEIASDVFHGGLSANDRKNVHTNFVNNKIRLLISTDLTARGLDIQGINVVINFDMPDVIETYIHRIGRSGRHGRKGTAISFVMKNNRVDECKVREIDECSKQSKMTVLPDNLKDLL